MEVTVVFYNNKVLEVELPISITLKVMETDPGVKGDTASGGTKPAILETGAQVMVPLFISVGEMIRLILVMIVILDAKIMAMKLDHDDLNRLIEKISSSDIQQFSLEGEDFKLEIKRNLFDNNQATNNLIKDNSLEKQKNVSQIVPDENFNLSSSSESTQVSLQGAQILLKLLPLWLERFTGFGSWRGSFC